MTRLTLFFTRGVSLQTWAQNGSLEREIALYLRLKQKGVRVSFVTYGNQTDLQFKARLQGIEILCNHWNLPAGLYETFIPFLHAQALKQTDVIKSNQTNGADVALRAARFWRKPMIARCGYMWSEFIERRGNSFDVSRSRKIESDVFSRSNKIVVTTQEMKHSIIEHYRLGAEKINLIPNYVLTDLFLPSSDKIVKQHKICFIGRLDEQKNLFALIEACAGLGVELLFIGEGHLRHDLQIKARENGVSLTMPGNLPHDELPRFIHQSVIYALVSLYEGHPKSLLEAMSCGAAVLCANSPGIREQIVHGETGWLVGTDPGSIRTGIQYLLENPAERERLGKNARQFIQDDYSIDKIAEKEFKLIRDLTGEMNNVDY